MAKIIKRIFIILLCLVLLLVLVVGGYVGYIVLQYNRIADNETLEVQNPAAQQVQVGQAYTAVTYNIGFGAYSHDFSFFMDSGTMRDGREITGASARANDVQTVLTNTAGAVNTLLFENPDFCLLQEVDVEADRSYDTNQVQMMREAFAGHSSVFATNFHSAYLFYPLHDPIGATESGLLTLSRYAVDTAARRSFPVDDSFPTKFFDLDRCFALLRLPVAGGGELVLINAHMSAYDEGGVIRAAQMEMLGQVMAEEYAKGNWVIVGGDFNHALCGTLEAFDSEQQVPEWVAVFDDSLMPAGFSVVCADNVQQVATCRSTDMAYEPGVNYRVVVDGFIVSDNVQAGAENLDTDFLYSDHNPVRLTFSLTEA